MYFVLAIDQIYCRKFSKFILNRRINLTVYEPNSKSTAVNQFVSVSMYYRVTDLNCLQYEENPLWNICEL